MNNPEEHVLTQYMLSADINRMPIPVNVEEGFEEGLLMLFPEDKLEQEGLVPQSGGVIGTVRSIFKAFGFFKPKAEIEAEEPISRIVAKRKRSSGLYGPEK